ncbi:MAG: molybdenum cofactor biosynthesis protein [Acidobacteria bacterium]|nr:MAG: molybdenum cofactor biosynthesis protein [Acidobacteriota bacterium]
MRTKMRPFGDTISLDEARALIGRALKPIERIEPVVLEAAHGRVLAQDVVATADVPPFSRAAMDGYAVRAADTAGATPANPVVLAWIEKVFTGQMPSRTVGGGECIEIATGAPMPDGADSVVMVEETAADGPRIQIFNAANSGQNIGRQGADIKTGQTVMRRGDLLNASRVGAIAALGLAHVDVYAQPRVAILSTGNEIVEPGRPLQPGQIYDINRFTVAAVVAEHGGVPIPHRTAADTMADLDRALDECLEDDVLVFSGGTSVGERDLILDALGSRGEVLFHGISVKPGKPTAFGLVNGRPFFGMPGYPSSCLLNTHILLVPALRLIARLPPAARRTVTLPLARRVVSAKDRHQFYTVRVADGVAIPAYKASGDITSMSQADGYFEIDAATDAVAEGTLVEVTLF